MAAGAWDQTALLWVTQAERHRNRKVRRKPFTVFDVNIYREPDPEGEEPGINPVGWALLERMANQNGNRTRN